MIRTWVNLGIANYAVVMGGNMLNGMNRAGHTPDQFPELVKSSAGKAVSFAIMGPVGTYRMLLAYHNSLVTNNSKWTNAIFDPHFSDPHYMTWPEGEASYVPHALQN
jgi:hypothetical protein